MPPRNPARREITSNIYAQTLGLEAKVLAGESLPDGIEVLRGKPGYDTYDLRLEVSDEVGDEAAITSIVDFNPAGKLLNTVITVKEDGALFTRRISGKRLEGFLNMVFEALPSESGLVDLEEPTRPSTEEEWDVEINSL